MFDNSILNNLNLFLRISEENKLPLFYSANFPKYFHFDSTKIKGKTDTIDLKNIIFNKNIQKS